MSFVFAERRLTMATIMTEEEFARKTGADLVGLTAAIEEARNDAITKETMNRDSLTTRSISSETEQRMRDYLARAEATAD